jgi:flagellar protein FlgJ
VTAAITDFAQFTTLRATADRNDPEALRAVASQFEALFLQTMLKSMRDASLADPLFGDSDSLEMYQDLMDKQLAMEMATGRGVGLADMIVRQLGGNSRDSAGTPENRLAAAPRGKPVASNRPAVEPAASDRPNWQSAAEFAKDVWPHVKRVAKTLNVAPVGILAQAALESGWGRHVMQDSRGDNSFNVFGIKAGNGWDGDVVNKQTIEFDGGVAQRETARFRSYADVATTFDDYAEFIGGNPRYTEVTNRGDDLEGFAAALQASGYATDPQYAAKIKRVAESPTMKEILVELKKVGSGSITHRPASASHSTAL